MSPSHDCVRARFKLNPRVIHFSSRTRAPLRSSQDEGTPTKDASILSGGHFLVPHEKDSICPLAFAASLARPPKLTVHSPAPPQHTLEEYHPAQHTPFIIRPYLRRAAAYVHERRMASAVLITAEGGLETVAHLLRLLQRTELRQSLLRVRDVWSL
ncbi:hypothetical protein B0H17DRAFT_1212506 [Mycena rosella]|uniref:Uncharacterized protein n=1 Tax=Mycena rosella TaxID=1033263 RepID=A0AAD7CVJ7_MYCRO|nr:hypothetical protein B0H17DRAFT_1212506 [Mycena rosella]